VMADASVRCCLLVPAAIVADGHRLCELLTETLDQAAAGARAEGWRLQGEPVLYIIQPQHAAAFGLEVTVPEDAGDYLAIVITVDAVDELDAMVAS
jgi:hypothetical protein